MSKSWGISQEITVLIVTLYDELNIVDQGFSSPRSTAYAELYCLIQNYNGLS